MSHGESGRTKRHASRALSRVQAELQKEGDELATDRGGPPVLCSAQCMVEKIKGMLNYH
jgi:hypothetical protein